MHQLKVNDQYNFGVEEKAGELVINGNLVKPDIAQNGTTSFHIVNGLKSYSVEIVGFNSAEKTAEILVNNNIYKISAKDQFDLLLDKLGLSNLNSTKVSEIKAPMPGLVLKIFVEEGTEVRKGDNLFVLEAMKMENIIKAPADVTVKTIKIKPGDKVEKNQVLMMF